MRVELDKYRDRRGGFRAVNLTPVIDIVFLLIVFFMVVAKFIEAENFEVSVPRECDAAGTVERADGQRTTVTVMLDEAGAVRYAVGPDTVAATGETAVEVMAALIEARLAQIDGDKRIVNLRVDEGIAYGQAQYALAAISQSSATDVQMAVIKDGKKEQIANSK